MLAAIMGILLHKKNFSSIFYIYLSYADFVVERVCFALFNRGFKISISVESLSCLSVFLVPTLDEP